MCVLIACGPTVIEAHMLIAPQEGKGAPTSQMRLNSRCAYNRIVGSRVIVKCALFRKTTAKLCGIQKWKQGTSSLLCHKRRL